MAPDAAMANSASTSTSSPLSWMKRLSPAVTYYSPVPQQQQQGAMPSSTATPEPQLILLLSWMGAQEAHVEKYASRHRDMFPSSAILVAQCPLAHVVFPWRTRRHLAPVLPYLRALSEKSQAGQPRLLVHVFSNGGIHTASYLRNMLRGGRPHGTPVLPRYVLVLDSCPGYFRWMSSYGALMQMLPWWAGPAVHSVIALVCLYHLLRRMPALQDRNARALRSPGLLAREQGRTYLYGTQDDLILWQDVEDNARKAAQAGFRVRLERFDGARHVDLMRAEPQRYWKAILTSWTPDTPSAAGDSGAYRE